MTETTDDRYGDLEIDGDHATITFRRHLPYRVETVWAALTDPAERAAWFGTHAFLDRFEAHLSGAALPDWGERCAETAPAYPNWS